MLEKVQFEVCVVGINNLICDMLLGVDVLEQIHAEINTSEHLLKCTIDNVSYTFKLNTHTHTPNHGDPIKITRPPKQVIHYKDCEEGETTLDSRTERRLSSLQEEFTDIFSEEHSISSVYEHRIHLTEPEKFIRRIYQVPIKSVSYTHLDVYKRQVTGKQNQLIYFHIKFSIFLSQTL